MRLIILMEEEGSPFSPPLIRGAGRFTALQRNESPGGSQSVLQNRSFFKEILIKINSINEKYKIFQSLLTYINRLKIKFMN